MAWNDGEIGEGETRCRRRASAGRSVREGSRPPWGRENPWEQLQSAYDGLQAEQPDSPTTESVETVLGSSRLPSIQRVRQLIEEAKNPKLPGPTTTRGQNYSALPKSSGGSFRTPTLPMT